MEFRELTVGDAAAAAAIEAVLFAGDNPWSEAAFRSEIAAPHTFYLGAFEAGRMLGYAGLAMLGPRDDPEFEIHTIGVDLEQQGRGLGRALMDQMMHTADLMDGPVYLEVRVDNEPAIALYKRFEFFTAGVRKNYYQASGMDAYTMTRPRKSERV
ncbi:ribosomal-protein-alanine N-acetyltransferase RimI [Corynebacterium sp. HMSC05C01]|uniref:ribosomal protein S18-alanine N-acetyltransferase n=1 Tax=Corynebacterium sp. HMSC05C01 TaxID=1581113 RepID=UPI0008A28F13|nr:ribosomal protein S18-alanine N-acetyltransferase [Corynebacterium sp. HMSC05C01]OFT68882.1 ribosomal-protein-alanine N-acetyltransferase RimI [Corynebacterium sp. HMSC05C01]